MDPKILPDCFKTGLCSGYNELGKANQKNMAEIERLRGLNEYLFKALKDIEDTALMAQAFSPPISNEQKMQEQIGCMSTRDDYPR